MHRFWYDFVYASCGIARHHVYVYIQVYVYIHVCIGVWGVLASEASSPLNGKCSARGVSVCEGVSASVVRGVWLSWRVRFKIVFFFFFCHLGGRA